MVDQCHSKACNSYCDGGLSLLLAPRLYTNDPHRYVRNVCGREPRRIIRATTGFETVTSAIAMQQLSHNCSE